MFDFPIKVDSLDVVPAEYKPLYEDRGEDGIVMIETLARKVEDLGNLTTTLNKYRKSSGELERQVRGFSAIAKTPQEIKERLEAWGSLGESPEQVRALIAEKDRLLEGKDSTRVAEQARAAYSGELKKVREAHVALIAEKDGKINSLVSAMIDSELVAEITKQKGTPEILIPIARSSVRMVERGGALVREVVDDHGDPRINFRGEPMTIADLVADLKNSEVFSRAFDGEGRSASGSETGKGAAGGGRSKKTYKLADWQDVVARAKPGDRQKLLADKAAGKINVIT